MTILAFVFPGQGSQKLKMLSDFSNEAIFIDTFNEAHAALNLDLLEIVNNDETRLNETSFTQPAILAASIALWRLFCAQNNVRPQFLAGHSLGEYTALVVAEVLSFKEALKLVHLRGQLMQQAVKPGEGAMAAILGLDDQGVVEACKEAAHEEVVSAVNFNAPGQVVIAGNTNAVTRAIDTAKTLGAKRATLLPVSVPSHCILMKPAADQLAEALNNVAFATPKIPVVQNIDAQFHSDVAEIKIALIQQLYNPVQWVKSIKKLGASGMASFIECGPGKVLTGLNKRIIENAQFYSLEDKNSFDSAQAALQGS
jgi:[acyl-carrier-protein] S-malonyltransferase